MEIDNAMDIIDSRDIINRIKVLEAALADFEAEQQEKAEEGEAPPEKSKFISEDEEAELKLLQDIEEQADNEEWNYGTTLIRESYFPTYAEELCTEIGDIPAGLPWYIAAHIDWEGVAEELKMDYIEIDFDGVSYYVR